MKNITLSAEESLIEAARERARSEKTTLNDAFRLWLETYAGRENRVEEAMAVLNDVRSRIRTGGQKFTRDEMNER